MGRLLTISLFYLVLMAPLCLHIQLPSRPDYTAVSDALHTNAARTFAETDRIFVQFDKMIRDYHWEAFARKTYTSALVLHVYCRSVYDSLERFKNLLRKKYSNTSQNEFYGWGRSVLVSRQQQQDIDKMLNRLWNAMLSVGNSNDSYRENEIRLQHDALRNPAMFRHLPLNGVLAVFAALQNDIAASDKMIAERSYYRAMPKIDSWTDETAIAVPRVCYAFPGQQVCADIMSAGLYNSDDPKITASEGTVTLDNDVGHWQGRARHRGFHEVNGTASIKIRDSVITRPWSFRFYTGSKAAAAIQFDKTNTCYRGIPLDITVPDGDYPAEHITLRTKDAAISKTAAGQFELLTTTKKLLLQVYAEITDAYGKKQVVGMLQLKIQDSPPPSLSLAGADENGITATGLKNGADIIIGSVAEDISYRLAGWKLLVLHKGSVEEDMPLSGTGLRLPANVLETARPGDRLLLYDLSAVDQYGNQYQPSPLTVRVL